MEFIQTKEALASLLSSFKKSDSLGLVPTMGALHQGHMALVKKALSENDAVIVSIFVNPTQFNNKEDLEKYPQTIAADMALLKEVSKEICVFAPTVEEIYAEKVETKRYDFEGLDKVMEGAFRDDHFNGVGTIVEALLRLVKPDSAYFGEKDFQQLQIIKKLVALEKIPVQVIGCPIVREPSGLAMSSRNERLSKAMRQEAAFIYKTLRIAKNKFSTQSAQKVITWIENQFEKHSDLVLEYIAITDTDTLTPVLQKDKNLKYRAFVAVYTENIRLIDNIALN